MHIYLNLCTVALYLRLSTTIVQGIIQVTSIRLMVHITMYKEALTMYIHNYNSIKIQRQKTIQQFQQAKSFLEQSYTQIQPHQEQLGMP